MRDPQRIYKILDEIKSLWQKYPDLRLGQLITSAAPDVFYLEDDELIESLKRGFNSGVEVRLLKWADNFEYGSGDGVECHSARTITPFGEISIAIYRFPNMHIKSECQTPWGGRELLTATTLNEAKAKVQADYNQRVTKSLNLC